MNIKNRLKKIESGLQLDSEFCRCERDAVFKVMPHGETADTSPEICDVCGKEIKHLWATFRIGNIETELLLPKYEVIEPRAIWTREEFREHQNTHTVSAHITYEEFLKQQNGE